MLPRINIDTLSFGEPLYLWFLGVPAALLVLWVWQVLRRRRDARQYRRARLLPVRERYTATGDLAFWLCLLIAMSLCIVALARPQARIWVVRQVGADFAVERLLRYGHHMAGQAISLLAVDRRLPAGGRIAGLAGERLSNARLVIDHIFDEFH